MAREKHASSVGSLIQARGGETGSNTFIHSLGHTYALSLSHIQIQSHILSELLQNQEAGTEENWTRTDIIGPAGQGFFHRTCTAGPVLGDD